VFLSGLGADECLGGYGRHRTVFSRLGWKGLEEELASDFSRLWTRNLGRDDRVIAWHAREARWPYLDEGFLAFLATLPLHAVCDFRLPAGQGDKRILRCAAGILGLKGASCRVKRAMHFGSRCVKHSDAAGEGQVNADTPFSL
jgi:asparagine synthetase B (glutamine-hydrolysing)